MLQIILQLVISVAQLFQGAVRMFLRSFMCIFYILILEFLNKWPYQNTCFEHVLKVNVHLHKAQSPTEYLSIYRAKMVVAYCAPLTIPEQLNSSNMRGTPSCQTIHI